MYVLSCLSVTERQERTDLTDTDRQERTYLTDTDRQERTDLTDTDRQEAYTLLSVCISKVCTPLVCLYQ
jgi:hypothetical protein